MNNPDREEIARLDGELAKLRLQLFQAFCAGAQVRDLDPTGGTEDLNLDFEEWLQKAKLVDSRAWVDRITALLALPSTTIGDDIAKAVEMCVRRCEALELERLR